MDLNSVDMTYSVRGAEKVVAVELKRNPEDTKPVNKCTGLWVGGNILPESSFVGMSYSSDEVINPVYAVFYFSNGDSIPFEIQDRVNIKDSIKIVNINKILDYNGSALKLEKFYKGLNYSSIGFSSTFSPTKELIDVKLVVNGTETDTASYGWSGGTGDFKGSFGFDPVDSDSVKIKITYKSLNKTDIIDLTLK